VQALACGVTVAQHGNPSASSDVRVAAQLLKAAAEGAAANIRINLDGMTDIGYRDATAVAMAEALREADASVEAIGHALT